MMWKKTFVLIPMSAVAKVAGCTPNVIRSAIKRGEIKGWEVNRADRAGRGKGNAKFPFYYLEPKEAMQMVKWAVNKKHR